MADATTQYNPLNNIRLADTAGYDSTQNQLLDSLLKQKQIHAEMVNADLNDFTQTVLMIHEQNKLLEEQRQIIQQQNEVILQLQEQLDSKVTPPPVHIFSHIKQDLPENEKIDISEKIQKKCQKEEEAANSVCMYIFQIDKDKFDADLYDADATEIFYECKFAYNINCCKKTFQTAVSKAKKLTT